MLFHRIHSPLVTWFFLFIQFVSISGFTAILRSFTQAWQQHHEPWPFCVVFGRGTPQFHNLATPPSRTPQLELELLPRLGDPQTAAHQVCWEAPEILGNCSCGAVSSVKTMASVQAVLVTVSHCKMQFCRFAVFPLQQACQRISVIHIHSSFCDFCLDLHFAAELTNSKFLNTRLFPVHVLWSQSLFLVCFENVISSLLDVSQLRLFLNPSRRTFVFSKLPSPEADDGHPLRRKLRIGHPYE